MTITISVSELRNNISTYLEKVMKGTHVLVRDEKRNMPIAEIIQAATFDKDTYEKTLRKATGIFSADNHPEWSTSKNVSDWVIKGRLSDQRSF